MRFDLYAVFLAKTGTLYQPSRFHQDGSFGIADVFFDRFWSQVGCGSAGFQWLQARWSVVSAAFEHVHIRMMLGLVAFRLSHVESNRFYSLILVDFEKPMMYWKCFHFILKDAQYQKIAEMNFFVDIFWKLRLWWYITSQK
jgi:hypothetical protein